MTTRKPLTAKQDLAEAKRRAKAAKTPIAKIATKKVVEATERAYSGKAPREAAAQMRRDVRRPPRPPPNTSMPREAT
jgi:hypothetical protein